MHLTCSHCSRTLEITGDAPSYCPYCGKSLHSTKQVSTVAFDYEGATVPPTDTPAPTDTNLPSVIGGYRLLRQIGRGGMGTVHEAEETATGRRVAVKLIARQFFGSAQTVDRFRQEGRLASLITHPRCVFVLAADEEAGQPYIVMELMPGETLQDFIERRGPLPIEQAVSRILDVIEGLEEAHRLGVVHRDVKPSNCFVEADGRVKIGDFGLSKSLAQSAHLTRTGAFIGTPLYASPEQVRAEIVDEQSDVYSVAATLYFLITGHAPHETGDAAATLARIAADPAPSMRTHRAEIPANLDEIVLRGLEKQRDERWRSLADFREALLPFVPGRVTTAGWGLRFGAFFIDWLTFSALGALVYFLLIRRTGERSYPVWIPGAINCVLILAYYGILEGIWGISVGKLLLGIRVRDVRGGQPPGLPRGLLRALVYFLLLNIGSLASLRLLLIHAPVTNADFQRLFMEHNPAWWMITIAPTIGTIVGAILMFLPARMRNGRRGLHEWTSGTRVIAIPPRPRSKLRIPSFIPDSGASHSQPPNRIGAYDTEHVLYWSSQDKVLSGEDHSLKRKVWLWLRPISAPALSVQRRGVDRLTRLRCLASGSTEEYAWESLVAPQGCTLPELVASERRLAWADARPMIELLTDELVVACADSTLPPQLTPHHVWVEPSGRVKLLDMPLRDCLPLPAESRDDDRALALLAQVCVLSLEGRQHASASRPISPQAPVPAHASDMLRRLAPGSKSYVRVEEFQSALRATRDRQPEVTRGRRMTTVAGMAATSAVGLIWMFAFVWMLDIATWLGAKQLTTVGSIALDYLRQGIDAEQADARAEADPIERANLLHRVQTDVVLEHRLAKLVEQHQQLSVAARDWLNPFVAMIPDMNIQIGGESAEDTREHRKEFRTYAERQIRMLEGDDPESLALSARQKAIIWAILAFWPAVWVLWAFVTRGGLVLLISGVSIVNSRGQPASRLRCAWRTFIIWLPVFALLAVSEQWQISYWAEWEIEDFNSWTPLIFWTLPWIALALVLGYGVIALWFPVRGPHDRLAGTYLVPR
jgi:hypothetical protein